MISCENPAAGPRLNIILQTKYDWSTLRLIRQPQPEPADRYGRSSPIQR
jgi:hypothetical protein